MIYRVVLDDLYDLHTSDINCMLLNPSLELEMNSAGSFNFTLPPKHPSWDRIEILKSTIDVYEDNDLIFTGRVANIDKNWNNERVVECEGALAYFNDSIHRQMKWETPLPIASEDPNVHNFLKDILDNHNVFVGDATNRQIHVGHIYVDPYLVTREVDYDTTLDILTRMCIDTNGGYFMIRKDPETHLLYLDWLKDFTEESGQPASFGVNLLDFNTGLHAADICTGVLARGATVNDQVVTLSNVELVDETTYPDLDVDHYTTHDQDILWHRNGVDTFGRVVQVHDFPDAQTDWKNDGQIVGNSLFEEAKKWLEEKNTKVESIEVEVAELSWLREGVPKYKLGQIVEILDDAHMAGEPYEVRRLPMYKLSCDLSSGSKKVTLGRPPKKELTQISASNSDSSTLSSGNSSGSSSGGGSGSGEECKVHDVRVDGTSVVSNKIANISLTGKADVSTVNALAATVATKADTSTVNALANVVSGKQDQIEFNTLEAATEVLTRLKADNVVYNLGGGTEVEANPSESATDDLETIKIGNTVYDISGGGGSSTNYGKFKCDVLFNTPATTTAWGNPIEICSEEKVKEYDAVYITANSNDTYGEYTEGSFVLVTELHTTLFKYVGKINPDSDSIDGYALNIENGKFYARCSTGKSLKVYKVYGLKFENKLINRSDIYSEEERMIGRWTDGKPLYQKTVIINNPSYGTSWSSVNHGINNIDKVCLVEGSVKDSINESFSINSYRPVSNIGIVLGADKTVITYINNWLNDITEMFITLNYTKTTDTPDSGVIPEDPQMVMMSDYYSENEQVVGRWTDGKPVYQKTIITNNNTINNWVRINISSLNVEHINIVFAEFARNVGGLDYWYPFHGAESLYSTGNSGGIVRIDFENGAEITYRVNFEATNKQIFTLQYTKTTDAPGTGPTKGNLIYLPALYSEEEREVGVWTDGKPLYQKTFKINVSSTSGTYAHNLNNIDNIFINNSATFFVNSNGSIENYYSGGYGGSGEYISGYNKIIQAVDNAAITIKAQSNVISNLIAVVTLQYTKTTDQPGSGTWTPEGQLAHHYSTSEKIVGTWIDGSTVYERTWDFSANPVQLRYNDWVDSGISSSEGIEHIIDARCLESRYNLIPSVEVMVSAGNHPVGLNCVTNTSQRKVGYLTLQYTKSS